MAGHTVWLSANPDVGRDLSGGAHLGDPSQRQHVPWAFRSGCIQDLVTKGTQLNRALENGEWMSFTGEEVSALALLALPGQPRTVRTVQKVAKGQFRLGDTPTLVQTKFLRKMGARLSAYAAKRP
jgi:hypothetical protein